MTERTYEEEAREAIGAFAEHIPSLALQRHPRFEEEKARWKPCPRKANRPCPPCTVKGEKICNVCGQQKKLECFTGRHGDCRPCQSQHNSEYWAHPWNALKRKVYSCNQNDGVNGRHCTINNATIIELFENQQGLCYISNFPISSDPSTGSTFYSVERFDNNIGHVEGNICLILRCFQSTDLSSLAVNEEVNTTAQWTRAKFFEMVRMRQDPVAFIVPSTERSLMRSRPLKRKHDANGNLQCSTCLVYHPLDSFNSNARHCKGCRNRKMDACTSTVVGFISYRCNGAKQRALRKHLRFDLTQEFLLQQWIAQEGRCYYLGVPLAHKFHAEWVGSLEKIEPALGYVQTNVVWAALEANTVAQWSRDLARELCGPIDCQEGSDLPREKRSACI